MSNQTRIREAQNDHLPQAGDSDDCSQMTHYNTSYLVPKLVRARLVEPAAHDRFADIFASIRTGETERSIMRSDETRGYP
jgi:hypothetical protein